MAADKKTPPKKPAAKKPAAKKSDTAPPPRKRNASRPPTIELKADEVVEKSTAKPADKSAKPKTSKPELSTKPDEQDAKKPSDEKKAAQPPKGPSVGKSKTPLIAAGLAGLLAGTAGGIVAGLILTGTSSEPGSDEGLLQIQQRIQKIEQGQKTAKPAADLSPRLEKAESDFRFLGTQLETLQKDIAALKDQLAVFSSTLTPSTEGAVPAPSIDVSGRKPQLCLAKLKHYNKRLMINARHKKKPAKKLKRRFQQFRKQRVLMQRLSKA